MNWEEKKGFTLVELMVAAYILLVGICGILGLFVNSMTYTENSWDITVATSHAEYILEEMQNKNTLTDIQQADWTKWAQEQNLITLPEEKITVTYVDPTSDPLDIQVVDQWTRKTRVSNVTLRTQLTK